MPAGAYPLDQILHVVHHEAMAARSRVQRAAAFQAELLKGASREAAVNRGVGGSEEPAHVASHRRGVSAVQEAPYGVRRGKYPEKTLGS